MLYKFNFTNEPKEGYISVVYDDKNGVPIYNSLAGYGFVNKTNAYPEREVHTLQIHSHGDGFIISEPEFYSETKDNYNNYGMTFRIKAPAGAYDVYVKTTSDIEDTTVSISGMDGDTLMKSGSWDDAGLISIKSVAAGSGNEWTYKYVNGERCIDIEIEPNKKNVPVGVKEIILKPISVKISSGDSLPTIFILGDSTVKSYTFDEAPMCGWGQIINKMFDLSKVNVINYSAGGRSLKNSYNEGRFNDILLAGKTGDYILLQFGHNDERQDENVRFGRGETEEKYKWYIEKVYVPAIRARGMIPVFVTAISRINPALQPGENFTNSFIIRRFPDIMKAQGKKLGITVIDLNGESVKYYNEIGIEGTKAIFMSLEAGETPGKTNQGSYANGHPLNKIDGTHCKEALAKQCARIVVTEFFKKADGGDKIAAEIVSCMKGNVKDAIKSNNWEEIFPEIARNVVSGPDSYYRNQIEKLIQLGVFAKDENGNFNTYIEITVEEYITALSRLMTLDKSIFSEYENGALTREVMGAILDDAYHAEFSERPKYMTDYNGKNLVPGDPGYDPNLDADTAISYYPVLPYEKLKDTKSISSEYIDRIEDAYNLGLIRSESGIIRGKIKNGDLFEPDIKVSRAKAAKTLYFMWVMANPVNRENHLSKLATDY